MIAVAASRLGVRLGWVSDSVGLHPRLHAVAASRLEMIRGKSRGFAMQKKKPRMDAKETNVKFASIGACSRLKLVADADEKHEAFARSVLCRFVLPTNY